MKFNHLNVPTHWQHYWTRYPEGHTILEALISWVSQVDSMVDNQNNLNANVEQFRNEIDEFVERFEKSLQNEVVATLTDWQESGFLTVVINEALQTKMNEIENNVNEIVLNAKTLGAVGDGVSDDTTALQNALDTVGLTKQNLFIPKGNYLITKPLKVPPGVRVFGDSTGTTIKKTNTATINIAGTLLNTILYTEGYKISIDDIALTGDIDSGVNGITFGQNTAMLSLNRLHIRNCVKAFHDFKGLWIAEFNKIQVSSCLNAFVLSEDQPKTTLTFKNCWAENCGQSYELYRAVYSTLLNCAADWGNYNRHDNPYGKGYGSPATSKGVYHFRLCRGVTMEGCGMEHCYGNGMVGVRASSLSINGATCYSLKSEHVPSASNPNTAVGIIVTGDERVALTISNVYVEQYENNFVDASKKFLIAYNYSVPAYGALTSKLITLSGVYNASGLPTIGGAGPKDILNDLSTDILDSPTIKEYYSLGGVKQYKSITLSNPTPSSKLSIPVQAQGNENVVHVLKISGLNNVTNTSIANGFYGVITFSSLQTVSNPTVLLSSAGLEVTSSGSNLEITLPNTYTNIRVECSVVSKRPDYIDFLNTTLV